MPGVSPETVQPDEQALADFFAWSMALQRYERASRSQWKEDRLRRVREIVDWVDQHTSEDQRRLWGDYFVTTNTAPTTPSQWLEYRRADSKNPSVYPFLKKPAGWDVRLWMEADCQRNCITPQLRAKVVLSLLAEGRVAGPYGVSRYLDRRESAFLYRMFDHWSRGLYSKENWKLHDTPYGPAASIRGDLGVQYSGGP